MNKEIGQAMAPNHHLESKYRNSRMEFDKVYFWTDTIKDWKHLLKQDKYKDLIISSWQELIRRENIVIYAFVIMPNHLHVVWEMKEPNGKEMGHASFNKFTSHLIVKDLKINHPNVLPHFKVDEKERQYRIWQRDPLAILMDTKLKVEQKINYIHNNPLHERWNLASRPEEYPWSSAEFYESGKDEFGILTHYGERF
ncbi:transposase [Dyadobacter sp. CY312]|uniref:transposase n=1 Tax=Dyadobacter sp. CY312 TaxID=2907303 RepID=UPI001F37A4F3|nr:transposase [Dyadobacter sp. CY312]MCE7039743.1 transposase [Dyadobacter sp. CY312]